MKENIIIAIDGPCGVGKGTIAKELEKRLNLLNIDTGAMYRCVALYALEKDISRIEITIHEGKNREVRKMCNAIGKKVLALHRSRIGNINVKDLKLGEWKYLKSGQIKELIK